MSTILFVVTGARTWTLDDGTAHPTGYWAEELLAPYRILTEAGHDVAFATPGGVIPAVDSTSLTDGDAEAIAHIDALSTPLVLAEVEPAAFDAVYYPGGHGPMQDLAVDADSAALIAATVAGGRPLAAVCHGLAAFLPARSAEGESVVAGRRITGFSDEEERLGGLADRAPYLLETSLRALGAEVEIAAPWSDHTVVDGLLITGQNPQSSTSAAQALLSALA
ncbi:type 1 glutamine amidotransferase domain-containing protein [Microbacterium saperdae]|uniref:Putative intracellular protease/amidase n=1 Tax=Microbacterium saperdae TaxID=69368 RepID=A0A543BI90_9MICO|nr:type 1 glutamine amidotransferase domain-containing protein [Microbacterium saperdae]TQL84569.1 putative intracellular protease/amidase [Microbacterium saperdae]GGM61373.1 dimethylallyltransferase [Microbacterium saperdae]